MAEYSQGTVRVWHGKWQGMLNYRESPTSPWKRKTRVLRCYHEPDPEHPGTEIAVDLPAPTGRVTKTMQRNAEKALKEWRDSLIDEEGHLGNPNATVAEYVDFYLNMLEAGKLVEPSTMGSYRLALKIMEGSTIGTVRLDDLAQEDGEQWVASMIEDGRASSSVRKNFNVLHSAVKHAVSTKRLRYDPLAGVRTHLYGDGDLEITTVETPNAQRVLLESGRICANAHYRAVGCTPWYGRQSSMRLCRFCADLVAVTIASLDYWFYANTSLLLVTGWENVRGLQTMQHAFNGCSGISMLDLTGLDPSALANVGYAFSSCSGLQTIYVDGSWALPAGCTGLGTFYGCTQMRGGNGTTYSASATGVAMMVIDAAGTAGYLTGA